MKNVKIKITTSVWSALNPNVGRNIQNFLIKFCSSTLTILIHEFDWDPACFEKCITGNICCKSQCKLLKILFTINKHLITKLLTWLQTKFFFLFFLKFQAQERNKFDKADFVRRIINGFISLRTTQVDSCQTSWKVCHSVLQKKYIYVKRSSFLLSQMNKRPFVGLGNKVQSLKEVEKNALWTWRNSCLSTQKAKANSNFYPILNNLQKWCFDVWFLRFDHLFGIIMITKVIIKDHTAQYQLIWEQNLVVNN